MIYKLSGGIGAVLLKCLHETPEGILVDGRVLEKLLSDHLGDKQADGTKFHINLDPLSRMIHLFIGLRDVLWVRRMYSHDPLFPEEMVNTGNGAGVTALAEFDPEECLHSKRKCRHHLHPILDISPVYLTRGISQ